MIAFAGVKENNQPEAAGVAMGLANMILMGTSALLQPIAGLLLDSGFGYLKAMAIFPLCQLVALIFVMLTKETGPKGK